MKRVINSGPTANLLTKEEEAAFLAKRVAGLSEIVGISDIEFDDEVQELTWQWGRNLLPYVDPRRQNVAYYKRRVIRKQPEFFRQLRLFKPLAMKYPTVLRNMINNSYRDIECKDMVLSGEWIYNEERTAGFTYEDFVKEMQDRTGAGWTNFKPGDMVSGVVVGMSRDGAFVEIGAKTWALLPTNSVTLSPISNVSEVLKIGQEIEAEVMQISEFSKIPGDWNTGQVVLSMLALERQSAWDDIQAALRGGAEQIFNVMVKEVRNWGFIVQTKSGMLGAVLNMELADKAGDLGMLGREMQVTVQRAVDANMGIVNPAAPGDFPIYFSYKDVATKELAQKLEVGSVVEAKVIEILPASVKLLVENYQCTMRKIDVAYAPQGADFELSDVFEVDEVIKVYVLSVQLDVGGVRFSTRALEPRPGAMLIDKKKVFAMAEATAKKYTESAKAEAEKFAERLSGALEDDLVDESDGEEELSFAPKKPKKASVEDIMGDDSDEPMF